MFENNSRTEAAARTLLPIPPGERIESIDAMRGLAIVGVLIAYAVWNLGSPPSSTFSPPDRIINIILAFFLDSKAYTLLAFLFGVGFSIQLMRAHDRETSIVPIYVRRLIALIMIGALHALLLRNGDILVPYATMGFVLLPFRNASNKTLLAAALVGSVVEFVAQALWELSGVPLPVRPETEGMSHLAANFAWVKYWYATAITTWPGSLPMFFFGLYIGRRRILENIAEHKLALRRVLLAGLAAGVLCFVAPLVMTGMMPRSEFVKVIFSYASKVHAWGFAAFYAAIILLLLQRRFWQRLLSPVAAVGRMALTNYLLQSIIIVPICILFDLYDKVTPSLGLALAVGVFLFQVPLSIIWLRYFRFGPAEWVWRSLTYAAPQQMRIVVDDRALPTTVDGRVVLSQE